MIKLRVTAATPLVALSCSLLSGCLDPRVPIGVTCDATVAVSRADGLVDALASASAGDCVLVDDGEYVGGFAVPAGVRLIGGAEARFRSDDDGSAALRLAGGEGSGLYGVQVTEAAGVGIHVDEGPAAIADVAVTGAQGGALVVRCEGDCSGEANAVELTRVTLRESRFGLWAHGSHVVGSGGESGDNAGSALTSGYGVIASHGADLTLTGFRVANNAQVGVLVDGEATRATLRDVDVSDNEGRGVFAQGLRGSSDEPALTVEGDATRVERNGVVGFGSIDAVGIIFVNGRVADTVARPIPTDLGSIEDVGDGVGLFAGSGDVRLDGVELANSARAQLVVDQGEEGIIFVNGEMTGDLKAVIQDTPVPVEVPEALVSELAEPLGIDAVKLQLPAAAD